MIMNDDKKRASATLIVSKIGTPKEKVEEVEKDENGDEVDSSIGIDSAVQEMFDALDTKDKAKFKTALISFIELCSGSEEEVEESEEQV